MIGRIPTAVSLWIAASLWHLYRLATLKPIYGTLGNNQRSETMMLMLFMGAGALRHLVLGPEPMSLERAGYVAAALTLWLFILIILVQGVLRATVRIYTDSKSTKDFIDIATLSAIGCSVVIDLVLSAFIWLMNDPMNSAFESISFMCLEISLIVANIATLHSQAAMAETQRQLLAEHERATHKNWR